MPLKNRVMGSYHSLGRRWRSCCIYLCYRFATARNGVTIPSDASCRKLAQERSRPRRVEKITSHPRRVTDDRVRRALLVCCLAEPGAPLSECSTGMPRIA